MKKFLKNTFFIMIFLSVISVIGISRVSARPVSNKNASTYCGTSGNGYNACQNFNGLNPNYGEVSVYTFSTDYVVYDFMAKNIASTGGYCISEVASGTIPNPNGAGYCISTPAPNFNDINDMYFGLVNTYNYIGNTTPREWVNYDIYLPEIIEKNKNYHFKFMFAVDTTWAGESDESGSVMSMYGSFYNGLSEWTAYDNSTASNKYISSYITNFNTYANKGSFPISICHNFAGTSYNEDCTNVSIVTVEFDINSTFDILSRPVRYITISFISEIVNVFLLFG